MHQRAETTRTPGILNYIYKSAIHTTTVMAAPIDVVYWQLCGVHLQAYIKLQYLLLCCSPACAPSGALLLNDTLCACMLASHLVMKREPLKSCMQQLCIQVGMIGVQYMYVHGFCQLPLSTLDLKGVHSAGLLLVVISFLILN